MTEAPRDPMRDIDLLLLEDLLMHRQLYPHLELPARTRALQAGCLLLVLACWIVVFASGFTRRETSVAVAATPSAGAMATAPDSPGFSEIP